MTHWQPMTEEKAENLRLNHLLRASRAGSSPLFDSNGAIKTASTKHSSVIMVRRPAGSPKTFQDTNDKTAAYSTTGASTYIALLALIKHIDTTTKPVSTRASAVTFTQTTTGQIDVYWASPPFGLQALKEGKIRQIARGNNTLSMNDQTVRVHIVNANAHSQRKNAIKRFMDEYRESYEFLYSDPRGVRVFAEYSRVPEYPAIQIRDEFMPKAVLSPDKISRTQSMMEDAMAFKILSAPLSKDQLVDLIQILATQ
jgi:NitT/TauT family transport system substrate-binding protein